MSDIQGPPPILGPAPQDPAQAIAEPIETMVTALEGFLSEYKIMLQTFHKEDQDQQKKQHEEEKEQQEEKTEKEETRLSKVGEAIVSGVKDFGDKALGFVKSNQETIMASIAGPLTLLTTPFQKFLGVDFGQMVGDGLGKLKGLFKRDKKAKKKPSADDVTEEPNGSGFLFLYNYFKRIWGDKPQKDKKKGLGGLLGGLFGGGLSGLGASIGPALLKALPIASILASIGWMIADAIAGAKMAETWGTSKTGAAMGAIVGGVGKGLKNAFKNAGKWALMGFGIGMLAGGPVGGLIGGLVGAVFGGIMGWIGGENLAKTFDKIGKWVAGLWEKLGNAFKVAIDWVVTAAGNVAGWFDKWIIEPLSNFFTFLWEKGKEFMSDPMGTINAWIIEPLGNLFTNLWSGLTDLSKVGIELVSEFVLKPIGEFFGKIFNPANWLKPEWWPEWLPWLGGPEGTMSPEEANLSRAERAMDNPMVARLYAANPDLENPVDKALADVEETNESNRAALEESSENLNNLSSSIEALNGTISEKDMGTNITTIDNRSRVDVDAWKRSYGVAD